MLLEGQLLAPCPDPPDVPVFEVATVVDGEKVTERYTPDDPALFDNAFSECCQHPLAAEVAFAEVTPEGDISVTMRLTNPGPASVRVVSEGFTAGDSTWQQASIDVPPGTERTLQLDGHDPAKCRGTPPWEAGHLLADDRPLSLSDEAARPAPGGPWC